MEEVQIRAVQLEKFGGAPIYTTVPKPVPKEGELLIKVEASTINPSDHIFIQGQYFPRPLPTTLGFEGVGRV
jgi:NADPH2:quinone reductase